MRKYLFILLLAITIISCGSQEGTGNIKIKDISLNQILNYDINNRKSDLEIINKLSCIDQAIYLPATLDNWSLASNDQFVIFGKCKTFSIKTITGFRFRHKSDIWEMTIFRK